MKKIAGLIIFSFIMTAFFTVNGQNSYLPVKDTKVIEKKLLSNSKNNNTIKSNFKQEKHLSYLNDTIISKGKFWFKKENKLRWEYISPFKYLIVLYNGKFIIKDEEKISEYDIESNKMFKQINNMILSSVRGKLLEKEKFEISVFKNSKFYKVILKPKDMEIEKVLSKIELYFDLASLNIVKVKMIESQDDYTIISFYNRKFNEKISDNTFIIN